MSKPRTLPRNVFETLHFVALVQGGIGAGGNRDELKPRCVFEIAEFIDGTKPEENSVTSLLLAAGLSREENDRTVREVNRAKGRYYYDWWNRKYVASKGADDRISWEEWCSAMNVMPDDTSAGYGEEYVGDPADDVSAEVIA